MYRRLYQLSGTSETGGQLVRIFAILPYREISIAFTRMFFQGFLKKGEFLEEELKKLSALGWLENTEDGYRMHPVIAESIRMKAPAEEEFLPFWERAEKCFLTGSRERQKIRSWKRSAWMIWNAVSSIAERSVTHLVGLGLKALFYMRKRYQAGEKLERLIERCAGLSEENRFLARSLQLEFMTNVSDYSDQLVTYIEKGLLPEDRLLPCDYQLQPAPSCTGKAYRNRNVQCQGPFMYGKSDLQSVRRIPPGAVLLLPDRIFSSNHML